MISIMQFSNESSGFALGTFPHNPKTGDLLKYSLQNLVALSIDHVLFVAALCNIRQ